MISLTLPIRTVSEANARGHWSTKAKRAKGQRGTAAVVLRAKAPKLEPLLVVRLTRVSPGELDDDNLRTAMKATRDGVADWLRIDDRSPLVLWDYAQERGKDYAVRVEVSELARPAAPSSPPEPRPATPGGSGKTDARKAPPRGSNRRVRNDPGEGASR